MFCGLPPLRTMTALSTWTGSVCATYTSYPKEEYNYVEPLEIQYNPSITAEFLSKYRSLTFLNVSGNELENADVPHLLKLSSLSWI